MQCPFCSSKFFVVVDGEEVARQRFEFLMRCAECEKRWKSNISIATLIEWDKEYNQGMDQMMTAYQRVREHNRSLKQHD